MRRISRKLIAKMGSGMVEASISFPVLILTAVLLIRLIVFYMEILDTSVSKHMRALESSDNYSGKVMRITKDSSRVTMLRGGILGFDLVKTLETKTYLLNEDFIVRAGELID